MFAIVTIVGLICLYGLAATACLLLHEDDDPHKRYAPLAQR